MGDEMEDEIATGEGAAKSFPPYSPRVRRRVPWRFDLRATMILVLLVAVGLGLTVKQETVGLGLPLLLLVCPAVLRSVPVWMHRKRQGSTKPAIDNLDTLFESCGVVFLLLLAGGAAFFASCTATALWAFSGPKALPPAYPFLAGGLVACVVLVLIGRRIYPPKD